MSDDESAIHLWLVLSRAFRAMQKADEHSLRETGLCTSDFAVLEALLHKGPMPVNAIGRKVLLTSGSITTAVDRLQERGLVVRSVDPEDRRVVQVHLTRDGRRQIERLFAEHARRHERLSAVLEAEERRQLVSLLRKLGRHVSENFS